MRTATGRRRRSIVGALALLLAPFAAAGATAPLEARVDRAELALGDRVVLEVTLRLPSPASAPRWELPSTPDFEVLDEDHFVEAHGTLGGGAGVQIVEVRTVVRLLRPRRAGALTIPSVAAVVQGRRYVTQPIVVQVSQPGQRGPAAGGPGAGAGASAGPKGRNDADPSARARGGWAYANWQRDVALRMEVSAREVWVGEQLVADTWLLSPYRAEDFHAEKVPSYDGFWRENLDVPRSLRPEQRGTQLAYLLARSALFPTRPGALTLEATEGKADIVVRGGGLSPFGQIVQVPRRCAPVTVRAKPLPPDAPPGFEPGNVGTLSLELTATPERVAVGEPVTVRITLAGDGNVRALSPPRLPELPGARAYAPATTDRTEVRGGRLHGTRIVEIVVVPDRAGVLVVPSAEWPYFDPRAGKYQVALTPAVRVSVDPARTAPRAAAAMADPAAGLRPIRADGALRRTGPPPWRRASFLALLAVPPLTFLLAVAAGGLRSRATRTTAAPGRGARRRLSAARRLRERDPAGAAAEAERALLAYAAGRLGRPATGLTRAALAAALDRAGAHPPAVRALLQALELVDASRYGAGDVHVEEVLTAAERALTALDEADWQPAPEVRP